eukprot:TRINITY_DN1987_c0_g1_i1.p1 TRINITY_DN1987_c0_g1~~TRINITY_DN1987_c0_g1_i1.p1  ORF type:complete len:697 (+),score=20.59 TRINITY_DN1987_c0_g1_i1:1693-3783(+)
MNLLQVVCHLHYQAIIQTMYGDQVVEILPLHGTAAMKNAKGAVVKTYDKQLRGYIYPMDTSSSCKMQFPKEDKVGLSLSQPFLVLQALIPLGKQFNFEVTLTDIHKVILGQKCAQTRRRLMFTTNVKEIAINPLHTRVPLLNLQRNIWLNLQIDLKNYCQTCFKGTIYRTLEMVTLMPFCKVRRVFVTTYPIEEDTENLKKLIEFPLDVPCISQVLTPTKSGPAEKNPKMLIVQPAPVVLNRDKARRTSGEREERKNKHEKPFARRQSSGITHYKSQAASKRSISKEGMNIANTNKRINSVTNKATKRDFSEPGKNNRSHSNESRKAVPKPSSISKAKNAPKLLPKPKGNPKAGIGRPPLARNLNIKNQKGESSRTTDRSPSLERQGKKSKNTDKEPSPISVLEEPIGGLQLNSFKLQGWETGEVYEENDVIDELIEDCNTKRDEYMNISPMQRNFVNNSNSASQSTKRNVVHVKVNSLTPLSDTADKTPVKIHKQNPKELLEDEVVELVGEEVPSIIECGNSIFAGNSGTLKPFTPPFARLEMDPIERFSLGSKIAKSKLENTMRKTYEVQYKPQQHQFYLLSEIFKGNPQILSQSIEWIQKVICVSCESSGSLNMRSCMSACLADTVKQPAFTYSILSSASDINLRVNASLPLFVTFTFNLQTRIAPLIVSVYLSHLFNTISVSNGSTGTFCML